MLQFAVELVPALALGLLLASGFPGLPGKLAPPLITWGIPLSLVALLLRAGFQASLLTAGLMAAAASGLGLLLLRLPALRRRIPDGSLRLGCIVGNTGYWGLPVGLALLPPAAIGFTIAFDLVATLITWSLGPLLVQTRAASGPQLVRVLVTSPAIRGLVLAVVLQRTPWSPMLAEWLWWPARGVILVALALVGMRLGLTLRRRPFPPSTPGLQAALLGKLLMLPLAMLLLAELLGLPDLLRDAVVLQTAAPTAISVLLLTEAAGETQAAAAEAAAGLVLWSTTLALVTVPLWWWLLRGPLGG